MNKLKEVLKNSTFAPYWHLEVIVAAPIVVLWTVLLIIIAVNTAS